MANIIKLQRNFMFTDIFNQERNVSKLERFISIYYFIPYDKVHGNLKLIGRKLKKSKKGEAWKEVDLLLKLDNELLKISIEINTDNSQRNIDRNIIYLCSISSTNYKEGDKNYKNIWSSKQINFNVHGKRNNKLISEYVLKEKETNEILSNKIQIDIINMEMVNELCYNELTSEKEKVVYSFCKMLMAETSEEFVNWSDLVMASEDSKDLLNQVEEKSNDDEYVYMESAYLNEEDYHEAIRNQAIFEGRAKGHAEGHAEGLAEGIKQKTIEDAVAMFEKGISKQDIIDILKIDNDTLNEYLSNKSEELTN